MQTLLIHRCARASRCVAVHPKHIRKKTRQFPSLWLFAMVLVLASFGRLTAQTVTTLHDFEGVAAGDGSGPRAGLTWSADTLYGAANGALYSVRTDGTDYTVLNVSGANSGLVVSNGNVYGTALQGESGWGAVFKSKTNGTDFAWIYSFTAATDNGSFVFTNSDGLGPWAGVVLSGDTLYGTASSGGRFGAGTVFRVNTDGSGFTNLHTFSARAQDASFALTNVDGSAPMGDLVLAGDTLFGTTQTGGRAGHGTLFKLNTDGTAFTTLHSFTNQQGKFPQAGLLLLGDRLYGTAAQGGASGFGTVFRIQTNGTGFTVLHSFAFATGADPRGGLVLHDNVLHGTTSFGAASLNGGIYRLNTNGTGFTNLYSFAELSQAFPYPNAGGAKPQAGLISAGRFLYGTAREGGTAGHGTIFSFGVASPRLTINWAGPNVILTWPTNAAGFVLESATNIAPAATWTPVSPDPVIVTGHYTVTNSLGGTERHFRLRQ